jgi:dTDP-4-dehydrorhamnose reductase
LPGVKALVLGAGGQLGSDLSSFLGPGSGLARPELSVSDLPRLLAVMADRRPAVVFNCAAYNGVDQAESEPELARQVNSDGAFNVAVACERTGARLVHFSTNFVFDGRLDRPYVESDPTGALGVYARSKLEGEERVIGALPGALVVRTAALFGDRGAAIKGGSFPDRILARAAGGGRLRVVADQKINPTYTRDLARAVIRLADAGMSGLVHVVAAGCCGWDEFARTVLEASGVNAEVEPLTSADLKTSAPRPLNGCLGSERVDPLRSWRDGLAEWVERRSARQAAGA